MYRWLIYVVIASFFIIHMPVVYSVAGDESNPLNNSLVKTMSADDLGAYLQVYYREESKRNKVAAKVEVTVETLKSGGKYIRLVRGGKVISVACLEEGINCSWVYSKSEIKPAVTINTVNAWNKKYHNVGCAYLDEDGDVNVSRGLMTSNGVSQGTILNFVFTSLHMVDLSDKEFAK